MKATLVLVTVCGLCVLAGCRQPDGPLPEPTGEQPNKIDDISRDLQNLASGDANARVELSEDLMALDPATRPPEQVNALLEGLSGALAGTDPAQAETDKMANLLFVAASARELSGSQIERVVTDLRETLVSVGADPAAADRASAAAGDLANAMTRNRKRWYHR